MSASFLKGLRRLRRMTPASAFRLLLFRPIDFLLYETTNPLDEVAAVGEQPEIKVFAGSAPPPLASRMNERKIAYAIFDQGRLVHESWVSFDTLLPSQFGFDPEIPVIGDCATDASYRGRRIYPYVISRIPADLATRGIGPSAYVLVAPDNEASIRGIERAGYVKRARMRGWRVLGFMMARKITRYAETDSAPQENPR
ncbi:MAG: hypothetical protein R2834_03450 [Rhodothermales bacterium]